MDELIEKAKLGDKEAFAELIKMMELNLYKIARARLNNIDDINDAIHETILKAFKYIKNLQTNSYFKTWITKILINECNNIYENNNKQFNIFNKIVELKKYKTIDTSIENIDDKLSFENLLDSLNYEEKLVVTLYYTNEYTTGEIANILNISTNTVKSRLYRAKEKIRKECKGGIYDESK